MSSNITSALLASANQVAEGAVARASATLEGTRRKETRAASSSVTHGPTAVTHSAKAAQAKGINFTTLLLAIEKVHGAGAAERVSGPMQGSAGSALRFGGVVAGGWYPIGWYQELWQAVHETLRVGEDGARQIGAAAAEIGVNRVYRMFSRLASPLMLMRIASSAFSNYYDTGKLDVRLDGTNALIAEWKGCTGFNPLLWADMLGGAHYFLASTGVKDVRIAAVSGGVNEDWLVARGTWR